ncbi:MAG: glutathione S-transferase family protein [Burkholderiales bacterium]|nr:MAG: glutathione S-transferase family protein [Burkholderiales bacterium]
MKLFVSGRAPSPRRVQIFVAEKGLELPTESVSIGKGEQFSAEFTRLNPDNLLPALVRDDGTVLGESIAICRYLEALYPTPALFGDTPEQIGAIEMWLRRLELLAYLPAQEAYRNRHPFFADRGWPGWRQGMPQIPELVARANRIMGRTLETLELQLEAQPFVAGPAFSMADIVALTTLDFAQDSGMEAVSDLAGFAHLARWRAEVSGRPSVASLEP